MKRKTIAITALMFTVATIGDISAQATDQQRLQGLWKADTRIAGGEKKPIIGNAGMRFEGAKVTLFEHRASPTQMDYHLDESITPKQIDMTFTSVVGDKPFTAVLKGIYEFDGDKLRFSAGRPNGDRPTKFDDQTGSVTTLTRSQDMVRQWSDSTGKFQIDASLHDFQEKTVSLRRKDGKIIRLSIEQLSDADQQFVRDWQINNIPADKR